MTHLEQGVHRVISYINEELEDLSLKEQQDFIALLENGLEKLQDETSIEDHGDIMDEVE